MSAGFLVRSRPTDFARYCSIDFSVPCSTARRVSEFSMTRPTLIASRRPRARAAASPGMATWVESSSATSCDAFFAMSAFDALDVIPRAALPSASR